MARKKRTYARPFTREVVTETTRTMRKDEYADPLSSKVKRRKKGALF